MGPEARLLDGEPSPLGLVAVASVDGVDRADDAGAGAQAAPGDPSAIGLALLRHLAARPGRVFSRRELLELVRDYEALDQDEKTINVHVSHLREKLEDDLTNPSFILTVRGAGYAFAER